MLKPVNEKDQAAREGKREQRTGGLGGKKVGVGCAQYKASEEQ